VSSGDEDDNESPADILLVDPGGGFEGVWNNPLARADQKLFLGVANCGTNVMPREGVEVGSKGDSSALKLSNAPGAAFTRTPWEGKCGVDGTFLKESLNEYPGEKNTGPKSPLRMGVMGG